RPCWLGGVGLGVVVGWEKTYRVSEQRIGCRMAGLMRVWCVVAGEVLLIAVVVELQAARRRQ
ncbi:1153_t:CDS:1, partial [Scutellospora calospora]